MKTSGFVTRSLLHAGTCSSLLSRAFWERPLSNLLLFFGMELSRELWGELITSSLPPPWHQEMWSLITPLLLRSVVHSGYCLLSTVACSLHTRSLLGNVVPSVSLDERKSGPHSSICALTECWELGPFSTPPPAKGEVLFQGSHCMLGDLIPSRQLLYPLYI